LCAPGKRIGGMELQLHSFWICALDGVE
jgi:hypothetical protein